MGSIYDATATTPRTITFSSENSISGSNSTFQSTPVDLGINDYDSVVLVDANVPKNFYNIPSGYNTFTLTELGQSTTITMPVGIYNVITLQSYLSAQLTAGSTTLGNGWTYTVTYSGPTVPDTCKLTYTVTGNSGQPSITMLAGELSPFRQMGFDDATTYTFSGGVLVSVNGINLALVLTAYIQSNVCIGTYNGILQQFLNFGAYPSQSVFYFQQINYDLNMKYYNTSLKNSWTFSLVDDLYLPIDTLGVPWSFTLTFFKRAVTHELHRSALEIQNEQRAFDNQTRINQLISDVNHMNYDDYAEFVEPEIHYPEAKE